ncbi:hypothetical protein SAMN04488029_2324 [Reichenbachiella faecimaris]|uniref:Uncharacterized protein n=1 Tax=Reichenbachiella faecimaris TaxID=692418 RepID=A0A1W2GEH3_REIFA|nr:hypothetical protein [Reichenbachiella faecimaris]SMD35070.1 hypothetical protein SAMN04488029_2324 [Reichenbachiella faecimaris]
MQTVDIKQESYFPHNFKIFGGVLIFGALASLLISTDISLVSVLVSLLLVLLGVLMIFVRYGLRIDPGTKTYTEYTWLLGLKLGQPESFHFIDKFYINQVTEQALATTRTGAKFDIKNRIFKAYIRLDNGEKLHLDTDKNEETLTRRLTQYKNILGSVYHSTD